VGARNAAHVAQHQALFQLALTDAERGAIAEVLAQGTQPRADTYDWERGGGVF
jgi:hypothetical protein